MGKHVVKCFYCGHTFDADKEEYVKPRANRYAHKACAQKIEDNKTKEEKDKEQLESYIKNLFGISSITPKIKKQIDTYHTQNNYSYSGMLKSLQYFFEIKGNSIEKANGGIGIIPYVYDQAYQYFFALWEAQQKNQDIKIEEFVLPMREVCIDPPKRQPMKHIRRLFTFLEEDGE